MGARGYAQCVLDIMKQRGVKGLEHIELPRDAAVNVGEDFLNGQAVIEQKNGAYAIRLRIPRGELNCDDAKRFADWASTYGDGQIMFTQRQNLIFRNVQQKDKLIAELLAAGYHLDGLERLPDVVACVGTSACPLAVSDTPNVYRMILSELAADEAWWRKIGPLKINMNGCPNSCAQHACMDIGLRGTRRHNALGSDEGYSIFVGGSLAGEGVIADYVCDVATSEVVPILRKMLDLYLTERRGEEERFGYFVRRIGTVRLRRVLEATSSNQEANIRNLLLNPLYLQVERETRLQNPNYQHRVSAGLAVESLVNHSGLSYGNLPIDAP
jgi:sulfite reductase beta subunit-like hemoprotein